MLCNGKAEVPEDTRVLDCSVQDRRALANTVKVAVFLVKPAEPRILVVDGVLDVDKSLMMVGGGDDGDLISLYSWIAIHVCV